MKKVYLISYKRIGKKKIIIPQLVTIIKKEKEMKMKIVKAFIITEDGEIIELKEERKFSFFRLLNNFIKKEIYYILFALIFTFITNVIFFNYKINEIIKIGYFSYGGKVYKLFEVFEGEK